MYGNTEIDITSKRQIQGLNLTYRNIFYFYLFYMYTQDEPKLCIHNSAWQKSVNVIIPEMYVKTS